MDLKNGYSACKYQGKIIAPRYYVCKGFMKMLVQLLDHQLALLLHKEIFYMLFSSNIVKYKLVGQNRDEFLIWESAGTAPVQDRPLPTYPVVVKNIRVYSQ